MSPDKSELPKNNDIPAVPENTKSLKKKVATIFLEPIEEEERKDLNKKAMDITY